MEPLGGVDMDDGVIMEGPITFIRKFRNVPKQNDWWICTNENAFEENFEGKIAFKSIYGLDA